MNWKAQVGLVIIIGALVRFVLWILNMLGLQEKIGSEVSFLISGTYAFLIVLMFRLSDVEKKVDKNFDSIDNKFNRIDEKFNEVNVKLDRLVSSKKASIDMRILIAMALLLLVYISIKAFIKAGYFG
tara:strand:+ start:151 stop:531 length:381 start_codon:yes stop_codon:yes gene_type:complete